LCEVIDSESVHPPFSVLLLLFIFLRCEKSRRHLLLIVKFRVEMFAYISIMFALTITLIGNDLILVDLLIFIFINNVISSRGSKKKFN
jgi:hypothetical protein